MSLPCPDRDVHGFGIPSIPRLDEPLAPGPTTELRRPDKLAVRHGCGRPQPLLHVPISTSCSEAAPSQPWPPCRSGTCSRDCRSLAAADFPDASGAGSHPRSERRNMRPRIPVVMDSLFSVTAMMAPRIGTSILEHKFHYFLKYKPTSYSKFIFLKQHESIDFKKNKINKNLDS